MENPVLFIAAALTLGTGVSCFAHCLLEFWAASRRKQALERRVKSLSMRPAREEKTVTEGGGRSHLQSGSPVKGSSSGNQLSERYSIQPSFAYRLFLYFAKMLRVTFEKKERSIQNKKKESLLLSSAARTGEGNNDRKLFQDNKIRSAGAAIGTLLIFACLTLVTRSLLLSILISIIAFPIFHTIPLRLLSSEVAKRNERLLKDMPTLLDIMVLATKAGLSFDAAFELYILRFETELSRSCSSAYTRWTVSHEGREEVLKELAQDLQIQTFSRFVDVSMQSLRFGSPLAQTLQGIGSEVRECRKDLIEEQIAKAPVKMLLPTGVMILPAMMLVVLGPLLLGVVSSL